jgi:hypothetical protein
MPGRDAYHVPYTLPELYECGRVAQELLAGGRQRSAALIAHEQLSPEPLLKNPHSRAYSCLCDVQAFGSPSEALCRDDLEKGPRQFGVHRQVLANFLHTSVD